MNEDSLMHAPEFVIKPRSHTVWEKQCVRLHCTVSGWPDPRVVWQVTNNMISYLSSLFFQKIIFIPSIQIRLVFNVSLPDFVLFFSNFCFFPRSVFQGTKTMQRLTRLPTLASTKLRADTACTHWRLTSRSFLPSTALEVDIHIHFMP